jgi:hypothetical protein
MSMTVLRLLELRIYTMKNNYYEHCNRYKGIRVLCNFQSDLISSCFRGNNRKQQVLAGEADSLLSDVNSRIPWNNYALSWVARGL